MIVSAILLLGLRKPEKKLGGREDTDVKEKRKNWDNITNPPGKFDLEEAQVFLKGTAAL